MNALKKYINERIRDIQADKDAYTNKKARALELFRDDVKRLVEKNQKAPWVDMRKQGINWLIDDFNFENEHFTNQLAELEFYTLSEARTIITKLLYTCHIHGISEFLVNTFLQQDLDQLEEQLKECQLSTHFEIENDQLIYYNLEQYHVPDMLTTWETAVQQAKARGAVKVVSLKPDAKPIPAKPSHSTPFNESQDELPF